MEGFFKRWTLSSRAMPRILLLDDDPAYVNLMRKLAGKHGIPFTGCSSLDDLNPDFYHDYDIAIIDYNLGHVTGSEVSRYLTHFHGSVPTLIISQSTHGYADHESWPRHVKGYFLKSNGMEPLFKEAVGIFRKQSSHR